MTTTWTPQTTNGEPPVERAYISELGDVVITNLNDVTYINTFIADNAGKQIRIIPHADGYHAPNILETGTPIDIPADTTIVFVGEVEIRTRCPTRPIFHLSGDGAGLVGPGKLVASYTRPVFDAAYGAWTTWATTWNTANPDYPVANWLTQTWQASWNAANTQSQYAALGPLGKANRTSAVTSYDASNILIDGLTITGFHTSICLQGMDATAANATETPTIQTYGNIIRNVTLDEFDFGILAKKQRDFTIDNITTEWLGHRVNHGQPHVIYLSNATDLFEESWNVNVGTVTAYTYEGGSVFKARGCKNLTWKAINCYSVHSAIAIVEACTGVGGDVLVTDQHETTDAVNGAGSKFAVNITNAPGFVIGGLVTIRQRAGEDQMKGWSVENSDGARFLQGCEVTCARAAGNEFLFRVRSSSKVYSGPTKYADTNNRNTLLFTMSDSQEEGGNASDCVLELAEVTGTTRLAEFVGLSANNQVWADPTKVATWSAATALVDNGLGGGNVLIDPRATAKRVVQISATTNLSLKASSVLTITRDGADPLDEDALPAPRLFSNNDTVTFASRTYTWKTALTGAANEILIPNATIVAAYPTMTAAYGYLQLAFLDAAVGATTYKSAGAGAIYGTGTAVHALVESDWGGNQFNIRSKSGGTASNAYTTTVSMTGSYASWTGATMSGGGDPDANYLNAVLAVTTGAADITLTLPDATLVDAGNRVNPVKIDTGVGKVTSNDHLGTAVSVVRRAHDGIELSPDSGAWKTEFASSPHVAKRGETSERLSITDYADDPTSGDWTDIFESAMAAGYRNIYADDRAFEFTNLIPVDGTRLEFGPNHTIGNAAPSSSSNIIFLDSKQNISIIRPFFDLPPMLEANTGSMANVSCEVSAGGIANPVVVREGGSGYTPANSTFAYSLPAGDLGTGGVITFTTVGGVIVSGTVTTPGTGYLASSGTSMLVGRSGYASYSMYVGDAATDYCQNILIEGARQKYGRGLLRVNGANNITVRDCLLEDGGSSYVGMTFEKATNFKVLQNRIYRGHGSELINGCAIRVSGDAPSILQTGLIAHNIVEDILIGNGIDSNLCNVRDVSIIGNIVTMRDPLSVYAYQLKQGLTSSLTDLDERGAKSYIWRDNQAILYHSGAGGWDLQNNIPGEAFEPWLDRTNVIDFRGCDDTTTTSAVRGTGVTGGFIGPTIVECHTGVRLTGQFAAATRNVVVAPLIRRCRYGVWLDEVSRSVGVRDADIIASDIGVYVSGTGTSDFRIEDTKVRVRGRRLNSITINTAGTGYTDGTYAVYANGGGLGLVFEVTVTAGALSAVALATGSGAATAGGYGYLGGASGSFKITIDPPNNWTGGTGGIVTCTVTSGTVTAIAIDTAGSGYLAGGNGVFAPEFGFGFTGTITVSGGICTSSTVTNGGIGFTSNPTLAIGNLTLPSGIGAGSGTLALTGAVSTATGYATRLIDVQSAKISGNWFESINSNVRLETTSLSCKNTQITDNTLVSSAQHITVEDSANEYTAVHNTRIGPSSSFVTTTIASGVIRATGDVIRLGPEGGVADDLDTINGALGFGHKITLAGSATAAITVTETGNIRVKTGTTYALTDAYANLNLFWDGTYWIET